MIVGENGKQSIIQNQTARIMRKCTTSLNLQRKIDNKHTSDKKYDKVRDHCHYAGNTEMLHIEYAN